MRRRTGYCFNMGWVLSFCLLVIGSSCRITNRQEAAGGAISPRSSSEGQFDKVDSVAILQVFNQLQTDKVFLRGLALENELRPAALFNPNTYRLYRGDGMGDADGILNALLFYVVEGAAGSNNWSAYYGLFSKSEGSWHYRATLPASIRVADLLFRVDTLLPNAEIKGHWESVAVSDYVKFGANYLLKEGRFVNSFTELHKLSGDQAGYLYIDHLQLEGNQLLPLTGMLNEYEKILGKGKVETPLDQLVCGTYFEDSGLLRYVRYPNFKFEISGKGRMALMDIDMKGKDIKIQSNIGTISGNTTKEALLNCFEKKENFQQFDDDVNQPSVKSLGVPTGPEADDRWVLTFDAKGQLVRISLFIPC